MSEITHRLNPFSRRVRLVRAWRGLAIGASVGALAAVVWSALDLVGVAYTEARYLVALVLAGAVVGALVGIFRSVPTNSLAQSIDRRARLEDRLSSASDQDLDAGSFGEALHEDADQRMTGLKPNLVYPIKMDRWHGGAVALSAVAAAIFLLGNTPFLLGADARKTREELKKEGETVKRIEKENLETPEAKKDMSEAEKKLADELRKFQHDLEKARMTKEESMQRANELAKKEQDLLKQTAKETQKNLNTAKDAMDRMKRAALEKAGLQNVDPEQAQASPEEQKEAEQRLETAKAQAAALQLQLDALNKKLADPKLTPEEKKALEEQKKSLEKQLSDAKDSIAKAKKDLEAMALSKEAADIIRRMKNDPLYKELQELAKKMAQDADAASKDPRQQISDEERKAMQAEFKKLLEQLKDDAALKEYLKELVEAMKKGNSMQRMKKMCLGLSALIPIPGTGSPGNGVMMQDIGKVNHSQKALPGEGSTTTSVITGAKRETAAPQAYVEIKAPTTIGTRSAVPYVKVLPSYRKKAESALEHQEIPKDQEKRVKEYFESLGH